MLSAQGLPWVLVEETGPGGEAEPCPCFDDDNFSGIQDFIDGAKTEESLPDNSVIRTERRHELTAQWPFPTRLFVTKQVRKLPPTSRGE